jgi:hypothetical protein
MDPVRGGVNGRAVQLRCLSWVKKHKSSGALPASALTPKADMQRWSSLRVAAQLAPICPHEMSAVVRLGCRSGARGYSRRVPFERPLNELCLSSPSDVMSRNSASAVNDGSTHVAFGFLMGLVSLDSG